MKPRLSRSLQRILAGVVVCCLMAQTGELSAAPLDDAGLTPGVASLGIAWRSQMERQLRSVRDRTTLTGGGITCCPQDPKAGPVRIPCYKVWANADIDYQKQFGDGDLPGYKYHGIGGTVGMYGRLGERWILGGAVTGMSGRISSKGHGSDASGDFDSYYANLFTRFEHNCWSHTLIGTVGWADVDFNRHHPRRDFFHHTSGSPDGLGFGVMYEVARSFRIDSSYCADAWWQPVLNVAYIHSCIDSYTEKGGNGAISVGEQKYDNVVFGAGARMQTVVGRRMMNRDSVFNVRVLGKAMTGDRRGEAGISAQDDHGIAHTTRRGTFGVEVGGGIAIPLGCRGGSLFGECTAEFAKNYRSVNGAVGYRITF